MDGTMRGRKILLRDLNAHLICVLCGGYYIDATSISECLHTFCRSCIVKFLKMSKFCPICDVQLNSKNPLLSLSPDKTLQRLVYKMVPGLYSSEMARRRNFYHSDASAASSSSSADDADASSCDAPDSHLMDATAANVNGATTIFYSPEDSISLSLEYYNSDKESGDESDVNCCLKKVGPPRRYLKCPAALKMLLLKKFLRTKYGLAPDHKVDIIYADADACLPDDISLMDVAYIFMWNRANPMRFSYRILEWSTVKVPSSFGNTGSATSPQPALTSDAPPDKTRQPPSNHTNEKESSSRGRRIQDDKRRIRESDSETEIRACRQKPKQEPKKQKSRREPSVKKSRPSKKKSALKKKVNNYLKSIPIKQTPPEAPEESIDSLLTKETDIKESIQDKIEACIQDIDQDIDNDISMELLEDQIEEEIVDDEEGEEMEVGDSKQSDSSKENEKIDNVDEKIKEDFALRDKQNDNDDLEDDDDFRLRISASEEDCAQEETSATVDLDKETHIQASESSRSKEKKESLKRNGEFKIKRKNKKAKHHHHHRHHDRRRDHHPPAATILPSPDTKDLMKLKVKLTAIKPDEQSKHHQKYNSHSPNRHHNSKHKISYQVISDDNESGSNSPNNSNGPINGDDGKSYKASPVVENGSKSNDPPNKKPSEERLSPVDKPRASPILIDSSTETEDSPTKEGHSNNKTISLNSNSSNKDKLLQMRSIRHKTAVENNSQSFRSITSNNNNNNINNNNNNKSIKDGDSDIIEIEEIKTSNSTILIPPSSITVSKITAAEKRKMDEEKLLKMSGKGMNEIDNKRPALEIMLVEAPPQTKNVPVKQTQEEKKQDDKVCGINASKINSSVIPIVKLQKSLNMQQNGRQSLLTIAQKLNNSKPLSNKSPSIGVNKSSQATPNSNKDIKYKQQKTSAASDDVKAIQDSNGSPLNKNKSPGSHDTGALDLSDKSSRKGSSPASSISSDGCPSPSNFYSLPQQQLNERSTGHQPQSGRSPVNNASMSPASASPKNGQELGGSVFPAGMRNLMTLSDTASQIRDMMAARDTTDRFQQLARTHNFQQKRSPQHYHSPQHSESTAATVKLPQSMLSPSTRAVLAQSSPPTHLKIPVPRALPINSKMIANRNGTAPIPDLNEVTINRNRGPVTLNSFQNRNNGMISKPGPNQAVRHIPNPSIVSFRQNQMKNMSSPMAVRPFSPPKKVGVNGRTHVMPPPPPAIPLASIRRMESMTRSLNIEKVAAGLQVKAAVEAGFSVQ
ncbi:hypothetical protein LSTR_LSTR004974 [Laodelphax striatellus]|uniref:RING-type domain-containing protein n=1 Tax=Laodelphax striatellus TaxID=195883 RepID=A0A482XMB4_LAOST|nr:hypothetical protein LSTR_LSTR004974 [Laodelphax striatellus]